MKLGRSARDEQVARKNLHRLVILVERRGAQSNEASISSQFGSPNLEHFAFHVQLIAWVEPDAANWFSPADKVRPDASVGIDCFGLAILTSVLMTSLIRMGNLHCWFWPECPCAD
jgi:hypothetical protein